MTPFIVEAGRGKSGLKALRVKSQWIPHKNFSFWDRLMNSPEGAVRRVCVCVFFPLFSFPFAKFAFLSSVRLEDWDHSSWKWSRTPQPASKWAHFPKLFKLCLWSAKSSKWRALTWRTRARTLRSEAERYYPGCPLDTWIEWVWGESGLLVVNQINRFAYLGTEMGILPHQQNTLHLWLFSLFLFSFFSSIFEKTSEAFWFLLPLQSIEKTLK